MMFRQPLASGFRLSTSSNSLHPGVWTGIDRPRLTGINDEIWGGGEGLPCYGLAFYLRKGEAAILVIAPCYERIGLPAIYLC